MAEGESSNGAKGLSESHRNQIQVLRLLSGTNGRQSSQQYEITDIARMSGVKDEKEVQRYLLILEGQKLVSPFPEGDFTSRRWQITSQGMQAMKKIARTIATETFS